MCSDDVKVELTFERVGRAMYLRIYLRDRAAVAFVIGNAIEEGLEVV